MISISTSLTNSGFSGSGRSGCSSPYKRIRGGSPAMKCRSEPLRLSTSFKNSSILRGTYAEGFAAVEVPVWLASVLMGYGRQSASAWGQIKFRQHARIGDVAREQFLVRGVDVGVIGIDLFR